VSQALSTGPAGAYQVQAAIAALHAEATSTAETDWPQIVGLYEALERIAPNPMVSLNRAVAVGMASGPQAGLALVDELAGGPLAGHHRVAAVRAHLLERAGEHAEAARAYREAAANATNQAEQRFLTLRASAADRASQL
jgi:predicted RNA polymerase sigma factor